MKFALVLRGISYLENYEHKYGIPKYTIDFRDTSESIYNNIINPLRELGHEVDIFFNTYHNDFENELMDIYKPKGTLFKNYTPIPLGLAQTIIGEPMLIDHHLECIQLYENYEKDNGFKYDNIIITRFDLYYYKKFTEVGIDTDVFNYTFWHIARPPNAPTIFSSEDNFVCYPRNKTELFKTCLYEMKHDKQSTHLSGKYLLQKGEKIKYLFGEKGDGAYDYPFYKFGRHLYGAVKEFNNIEDSLRIPMNRIYHSIEEQQNPSPIYVQW